MPVAAAAPAMKPALRRIKPRRASRFSRVCSIKSNTRCSFDIYISSGKVAGLPVRQSQFGSEASKKLDCGPFLWLKNNSDWCEPNADDLIAVSQSSEKLRTGCLLKNLSAPGQQCRFALL